MSTDGMTEIDDYVRTNRGTYTDEAIRDTLVSAGHDPAAVDSALAASGAQTTWDPEPAAATTPSGLVSEAWILFIVCGFLGFVGFSMGMSFSGNGSLGIFAIGYIAIGLAIVMLVRWAVPRFGIKGIWAVLLGFAMIPMFGALMLGTCVAAFAGRS